VSATQWKRKPRLSAATRTGGWLGPLQKFFLKTLAIERLSAVPKVGIEPKPSRDRP
jgi:hypothetical protein